MFAKLTPEQVAIFDHCQFKAKVLFGDGLILSRPKVNLNGYNASLFENLESCIVYLYSSNKKYRVHCEVAKSEDLMMLGRKQALVMGYISFPEILQPTKIDSLYRRVCEVG